MMTDAYLQLKLARELFDKPPEALSAAERERVAGTAERQRRLEARILAAPEAAAVVVPEAAVDRRLAEIRARYDTEDAFARDLAQAGLAPETLREALATDLRVEAVLEAVASRAPAVTALDAELYYHNHPDAFDRPEARRLRHILVTFCDAGERARAVECLEAVRKQAPDPCAFGEAALAHSHCPTAMQAGVLGVVRRGQLYPELEPAAFALAEGRLSEVLESPVGLHLLRCDEILPHGPIPFAEVAPKIVERLAERRRAQFQKDWVRSLEGASRA